MSNEDNVNCKKCGQTCVITESKSQANPGKEFYQCPSKCKGAFNGWVDIINTTQKAKSPDTKVNSPTGVYCPQCQTECIERTSFTQKTYGKKFLACPKACKGWIGWVAQPPPVVTDILSTPANPTITYNNEPKPVPVPVLALNATKAQTNTRPLKSRAIAYYCANCDRNLDIDCEVALKVKKSATKLLESKLADLKRELTELISNGEYSCTECE